MTTTLEHPAVDLYPVLKSVHANTECIRCYRVGRVEWLPDGMVRVLHHDIVGNRICIVQLPASSDLSDGGRALLLLR